MQAVLELGHFPSGMEFFPAIDIEQFNYIKQVINDSDYYILILGARYGSLDENGVSFTEKEYDYAVSQKIPVLAFLHDDILSFSQKVDVDKKLHEKLQAFRAKVEKGRVVKYWKNPDDLKAKVIISLNRTIRDTPRVGWIRAVDNSKTDTQKQLPTMMSPTMYY